MQISIAMQTNCANIIAYFGVIGMNDKQRKLRNYLKTKGFSLNKFGPAMGLTRQAIQHWEFIPDGHIKKAAKLLKVRQKDLKDISRLLGD